MQIPSSTYTPHLNDVKTEGPPFDVSGLTQECDSSASRCTPYPERSDSFAERQCLVPTQITDTDSYLLRPSVDLLRTCSNTMLELCTIVRSRIA